MNSFNRSNLQNIRNIFGEKTGVALPNRPHHCRMLKTALLTAALLLGSVMVSAAAAGMFSSLSGDELSLDAAYSGNGVVMIRVENRSGKNLSFQHQLRLMQWSTGEEIEPVSDCIRFDGTDFAPHTEGTMTVDISQAYDICILEQPLIDDHYYFVLTNNNFVFGQDWMCAVPFAEPVKTEVSESIPVTPAEADEELIARVIPELQPWFSQYHTGVEERREQADSYLAKCRELLAASDREIVISDPSPLVIDGLHPDVMLDKNAPAETQHWLSGLHRETLDGYGIPVGATADESALVLGAYVPLHKGEIDGGAEIPLLYFFTYRVDDVRDPGKYAFIHGQLLTFAAMAAYKVYEDEQYACYDVTDLFYSDLRRHAESIAGQRRDICFDEDAWERVENIYTYYRDRDVLGSRFYYNAVYGG